MAVDPSNISIEWIWSLQKSALNARPPELNAKNIHVVLESVEAEVEEARDRGGQLAQGDPW